MISKLIRKGVRIVRAPFLLVLLLVSACGDPGPADESPSAVREFAVGDSVQVVGRVVDTRCFSHHEANLHVDHPRPVPADHSGEDCAAFCARAGYPVGITRTDSEDDVLILLTTPQIMADYMDQTVRVSAIVRSEGVLIPQRIELRTEDGWTFIM